MLALGSAADRVRAALIVAGVAAGISATFLAQLSAVLRPEVVLGGIGGFVFIVPILACHAGMTKLMRHADVTPSRVHGI